MGLNVASVKSYVSSALTTTLFGSGVGEREVGKLTSIIMNKMLFAQGWQFSVEVDGLEGADFFAKDITYHDYSIEYETIKIGGGNILQPTERSPGQITMMVRDTVDGLVLDWFKTAKGRVINPDGTGNIPSKYLLNVRIYRLLSSGLTKLENEMTVFPVTTGDVTYARDQVTEFKSFPMTFALHSTFNQSSSSLTSLLGFSFSL
ncbi:phage tail protein [Escherichia coli]|uniref:phage tail protein n=1 Tax=Escherichia coli TaxID=562 RepID=UPI0030C77B97